MDNLLETIVTQLPPPKANREAPLKALIFDSWFDKYRGAVVLVYIQDGCVKEGDIITTVFSQASYTVKNVGILRPTEFNTGTL